MARLNSLDGASFGIHPVPVVDRDGVPYELTLRLERDGQPFGAIGERCGWFLAATADRLRAAIADESPESEVWPDPADRFPSSAVEGGVRAWAVDSGLDPHRSWEELARYLPRDRELFAFRHRDPDDLASEGELRCSLHSKRTWVGGEDVAGAGGRWKLACRAVLDAWGDHGQAMRAVLTAPELAWLLDELLDEAGALGCVYEPAE